MDLFEEIADERRELADILAGLTPGQRGEQSLCEGWTVADVAGHLVVPLEVSLARFGVTMLLCGGSFDRANRRLAHQQSHRPFEEIVDVLRCKAGKRFTPPGAGPEAPLTDLLVHGLDIRWPLGLHRQIPHGRSRASLDYLVSSAAKGLAPRGLVEGLRLEATDIRWAHGEGDVVRGPADAFLLTLAGRRAGLDGLSGDGLALLRRRMGGTRAV